MTTEIETIREALGDCLYDCPSIQVKNAVARALVALDRIEGRCLPELPEGRRIGLIGTKSDNSFECWFDDGHGAPAYFAKGSTPAEAVQSALSKIPPAKTGSDER